VAANVYCGPMKKQQIRALITAAGSGSSGNLIRALRATRPRPYIAGMNDDRFVLKMSLADRNHVSPAPASDDFVRAMLEIIKRERINVVMPTDENIVKVLSEQRGQFPIGLLLPRQDTIDLCQDKHALNLFLRRRAIPAPLTYNVNSLKDLDGIFARFSRAGVLWCRVRRGARSVAATPVSTVEQARAWITQWRDLQGIKVSDFTLGEYLPGRHYVIPSVWRDGKLLRAQSIEVLGYFAAGNNPSGTFSLSCLAKTIVAGEALQTALKTVQAIEEYPSGVFVVELKETADAVPAVTEINAGRFPAGVTALLAVGEDNMVEIFARAAVGEAVTVACPYGSALEYYMVRDIDTVPSVFSAAELLEGI
jgi:hypothetical protein